MFSEHGTVTALKTTGPRNGGSGYSKQVTPNKEPPGPCLSDCEKRAGCHFQAAASRGVVYRREIIKKKCKNQFPAPTPSPTVSGVVYRPAAASFRLRGAVHIPTLKKEKKKKEKTQAVNWFFKTSPKKIVSYFKRVPALCFLFQVSMKESWLPPLRDGLDAIPDHSDQHLNSLHTWIQGRMNGLPHVWHALCKIIKKIL